MLLHVNMKKQVKMDETYFYSGLLSRTEFPFKTYIPFSNHGIYKATWLSVWLITHQDYD